ncbi:cellulose binding domain-containing protein [Actinoplanes sp. NPDC049265]|uniref:cellulose binding domain-containing protein n=1 Tax=Actinoplanes sp. NPDC049265 TaxID=3363902 RepID=UPI00371C654C
MARRTITVVVLDALLSLGTRLQAGPTPQPRVRTPLSARSRLWRSLLAIGVAAAMAGTAMLITALVRTPETTPLHPEAAAGLPGPPSPPPGTVVVQSPTDTPEHLANPSMPPLPSVTSTSPTASGPAFTLPGGAGRPPSSQAGAPPLTAHYGTSSLLVGLLGYRVTATVTNPGSKARDGWHLVVTLPRPTLAVAAVSGATASQSGSTWTFTPDKTTSRVPAGKSVTIGFDVRGATLLNGAPAGCQIDNNPCS